MRYRPVRSTYRSIFKWVGNRKIIRVIGEPCVHREFSRACLYVCADGWVCLYVMAVTGTSAQRKLSTRTEGRLCDEDGRCRTRIRNDDVGLKRDGTGI